MAERLQALSGEQRQEWAKLARENRAAILGQYTEVQIAAVGLDVMADTLRVNPNIPDVVIAPESFGASVEKLLCVGITPHEAYLIVGEAVLMSRHLAGIRGFERV